MDQKRTNIPDYQILGCDLVAVLKQVLRKLKARSQLGKLTAAHLGPQSVQV